MIGHGGSSRHRSIPLCMHAVHVRLFCMTNALINFPLNLWLSHSDSWKVVLYNIYSFFLPFVLKHWPTLLRSGSASLDEEFVAMRTVAVYWIMFRLLGLLLKKTSLHMACLLKVTATFENEIFPSRCGRIATIGPQLTFLHARNVSCMVVTDVALW